MRSITENLAVIRTAILNAAERAGRSPSDVKLLAVSKNHPSTLLKEAADAGIHAFGENRVQEAESKISDLGDTIEWHLIGHLQKNKVRKAVQLFDMVHSVDSIELAERMETACNDVGRERLPVLIQVDLAGEESKSGIAEEDILGLVSFLKSCKRLDLKGLMLLPPYFEDPEETRPYFKRLCAIRDDLVSKEIFANGETHLSMGMSHDFEVAIEEGATIVRVGTAIFGDRKIV